MSTASRPDSLQRPVFEFKSNSLTVPVLVPAVGDLNAINEQLAIKIGQAPEFFNNSPVLVDLQKIVDQNIEIDLSKLIKMISEQNLLPIGIRGGSETHKKEAIKLKLSVLADHRAPPAAKKTPAQKAPPAAEPAEDEEQKTAAFKIITQPVRSGQRVYANGDLIITAQVSAGAEIMAEGNIHVYGTLRGRALAGVLGDAGCRIFCSDLQAELISIAGQYRISEDITDSQRGKPVQIYLDNQALIIDDIK